MLLVRSIVLICLSFSVGCMLADQVGAQKQESSTLERLYSTIKTQIKKHPYLSALALWIAIFREDAYSRLLNQAHKPYYFVPVVGTIIFYLLQGGESDFFSSTSGNVDFSLNVAAAANQNGKEKEQHH